MHLIYLDESGNTGMNLKDKQQPVFVLCALIIDERRWKPLEIDLRTAVKMHLPDAVDADQEIHATDLRTGRGPFGGRSVAERIAFRDQWFAIAARHGVKVVSRSIAKHRLANWIERNLGSGVGLNPHRPAFPLVARVVNAYLASLKPPQLGIFISDENREIVSDVEQTIRLLRV
ncbi:MAG: DUF3800 domain-containing protein [Phycisphaerales bacterium]|nr:DUF3800 domain-containing protein [Phycisphaerales bacterium]